MATFPALKTGAVAQYPSDRQPSFSTQVVRFLNGSEQRFPAFGTALRQWVIRLDLLDESELTILQLFFVSQGGRAQVFTFTDPFDGTVYTSCSFGSDVLELSFNGPQQGQATVTVVENRG